MKENEHDRREAVPSLMGTYGSWIGERISTHEKEYSFLHDRWRDATAWRVEARKLFAAHVLSPDFGRPSVEITGRRIIDGLVVEDLAWALPHGPVTRAWFLKPETVSGRLPGILALHDHGANKYFGKSKIADGIDLVHPHVADYRRLYYGGRAWANELAKRGYAVLVHDAFPFESRKIQPSDLPGFVVERAMQDPEDLRELAPGDSDSPNSCTIYDVSADETMPEIDRYNAFAGQYESIIAKCLFSAGLTWPGLVLAEDRVALDYLSSRPDIDPERIGCGGLSGGGLRTNYLAGTDSRIGCSVTTGFMTTWNDFAMNTAFTHTWMIYVPGLPRHMDYPDILAMRAPRPTLVQSSRQDPLFSREEVTKANALLESAWKKAGAGEGLRISSYDGPHQFGVAMQEEAFAWYDRWLK